ncbi:hypothetical protein LTR84_000708 [Exophiala bonariae]|uniref:NFX1-type zinc finger-containing protein 1 n=1 Tax=Exophiala bonariae TaxID=1690606 RepID=A0AAV9NRC5_9EURO|nr:hypothetical protein LTR84_000708 [Exophiala bonariae]
MESIRARPPSSSNSDGFISRNVLSHLPRPHITFTDDGPGHLSRLGPRHDNDHVDYRSIQILPTADEILAVSRPIYMPQKDLLASNFLEIGMNRHLDLLFRQLRCDSVESIRDICYSAAQMAFLNPQGLKEKHVRQETEAGNRFFIYDDVHVEELLIHQTKGMLARLSYHCPTFMRGTLIYDSGRFREGMLVALLELDASNNEFSVNFMEVHLVQSTMSMNTFGGAGIRAAVQLSFPLTSTRDQVHHICRHALRLRDDARLVLVEFPKVLYAGFHSCLDRLQKMQENDVSFAKYIAPSLSLHETWQPTVETQAQKCQSTFDVPPPGYTQRPGFSYSLKGIVPHNCAIKSLTVENLSDDKIIRSLQDETTLDKGQAIAFRDSLSREFAFTQGPPGCGKTFLAVQLAKTLLQSRANSKPILLVCLTNHALDKFLGELRDAGVGDILRVGRGSKEEWTEGINLRNRKKMARSTREETQAFDFAKSEKNDALGDLDDMCKAISSQRRLGFVGWHFIKDSLERNSPGIYAQFCASSDNHIGRSFTFEYWSTGGDLDSLKSLHVELASRFAQVSLSHDKGASIDVESVLLDISEKAIAQNDAVGIGSVWNFPLTERLRLLHEWELDIDAEQVAHKLTALYWTFQDYSTKIKKIRDQRDARTMLAHKVIGLTTTACASRRDVLESLGIEIMACEEAGEVMEPHTLCSLLPTLQHAIFIGDPLQLRPELNEQSLTLETDLGSRYRLDESLLERLMFPRDPALSTLPSSQLDIQRRMHPDIANITRLTYPFLKDHQSTYDRSQIYGLKQRMFWWDHRVPELEASDDLKSHANLHEVEMVAGLVEYLLKGGNYAQGEIAVLTPYSGQLAELVRRLSITCNVWLNDKDRQELLTQDLLDLGEDGRVCKDEIAISDMLRLTTVDNFQGEEAKIIVLSTVRSGGPAGFLKTLNRINVACSRAREGFYIIGNSRTLSQVPMWMSVIASFNQNIGASIETGCHRHPETNAAVKQPSDFATIKECSFICEEVLDCGHQCVQNCHPSALHERLACQEECDRVFPCGHKCTKLCYQTCKECELSIDDLTLPCGHEGKKLCSGAESKCAVVVKKTTLECGHDLNILCGEDHDGITRSAVGLNVVVIFVSQLAILGELAQLLVSNNAPRAVNMGHAKIAVRKLATLASSCLLANVSTKVQRTSFVAFRTLVFRAHAHVRKAILLSKMGWRMYRFTESVEFFQQSLSDSLETFISEIRPNPLAALANTRHILQRQREVIELHKSIVRYRNEIIIPVEESLQSLHVVMARRVPSYAMLFQTRFDVLEYRAMSLRIADDLKLARLMVKLADPSQGVQRQGVKMLQFVVKQSHACVTYCQKALSRRHVTSAQPLEAELRLQKTQFLMFATEASLRLSRLGYGSASALPVHSAINELQMMLEEDDPDFTGRNAFINTLGGFQDYFLSVETDEVGDIPDISNESTRTIEKSWSQHELGGLITCPQMHIYSRKTFPRGCPGCGIILPSTPEINEPAKPLREAEFLKVMHLRLNTNRPALPGGKSVSYSGVAQVTTEKESPVSEARTLVQRLAETPGSDHCQEMKQEVEQEAEEGVEEDSTEESKQDVETLKNEREMKDLENREKFLVAMRKLGL